MLVPVYCLMFASLATEMTLPVPEVVFAANRSTARGVGERWSPETVDDEWAAKVLVDPGFDRGWLQPCHDDGGDDRESACEVREFPFHGRGPIAIHGGANGGMTVIGWDRADTRVIYRVKARARTLGEAQALAKQVRLESTKGWIRPVGPDDTRGQWWSVEVKAWVPRASDLSLQTRNGPIGVRQVRGTMEIRSQNGPVALIDLSGAVLARAQNGPLHVELAGSRWDGAGLDAEAQNGPVELELPRGFSARLETGTLTGPTDIDYPLEFQRRVRGHFTTTLGSGGAPVRVVTENGPFRLAER